MVAENGQFCVPDSDVVGRGSKDCVGRFSGLAVFSAADLDHSEDITATNVTQTFLPERAPSFHPFKPYMVFQHGIELYFWSFRSGRPESLYFATTGHVSQELGEKVSFSPCGKYVALHRVGRDWPQPLELRPCYQDLDQVAVARAAPEVIPMPDKSREHGNDNLQIMGRDDSKSGVALSRNLLPTRLHSSESTTVMRTPEGLNTTTLSTRVASEGAQVEIGVGCLYPSHKSKKDGDRNIVSLVQLPNSIPVENTATSVHLPEPGISEVAKIILNSEHDARYRSDEPQLGDVLPIVLRKDPRAFYVRDEDRRLISDTGIKVSRSLEDDGDSNYDGSRKKIYLTSRDEL
ncbi:hypothetical protein BX600DRAFT_519418 [Xylariales sp. PMI_506]|nr:hypothetical protein BX600DRAFT_519418 [Xylariales sp. PMI_506]